MTRPPAAGEPTDYDAAAKAQAQSWIAEIREIFSGQQPRIEFDTNWNGEVCLRLYRRTLTKGGKEKWERFGPLIFGPEGVKSHTEVLRHFINLLENPKENP